MSITEIPSTFGSGGFFVRPPELEPTRSRSGGERARRREKIRSTLWALSCPAVGQGRHHWLADIPLCDTLDVLQGEAQRVGTERSGPLPISGNSCSSS